MAQKQGPLTVKTQHFKGTRKHMWSFQLFVIVILCFQDFSCVVFPRDAFLLDSSYIVFPRDMFFSNFSCVAFSHDAFFWHFKLFLDLQNKYSIMKCAQPCVSKDFFYLHFSKCLKITYKPFFCVFPVSLIHIPNLSLLRKKLT